MNLCVFSGRLTRDPEVRNTQTGKTVVNFTIALNEGKDRPAIFVDLEAWENQANFIVQHFKKAKPITVQSRLQMDKWEDKTDGTPRSKAKFVVDRVSFVPGGSGGNKNENEDGAEETEVVEEEEKERSKAPKRATRPKVPKPVEDEDDIPF